MATRIGGTLMTSGQSSRTARGREHAAVPRLVCRVAEVESGTGASRLDMADFRPALPEST
jgi:hypothetical protein